MHTLRSTKEISHLSSKYANVVKKIQQLSNALIAQGYNYAQLVQLRFILSEFFKSTICDESLKLSRLTFQRNKISSAKCTRSRFYVTSALMISSPFVRNVWMKAIQSTR